MQFDGVCVLSCIYGCTVVLFLFHVQYICHIMGDERKHVYLNRVMEERKGSDRKVLIARVRSKS